MASRVTEATVYLKGAQITRTEGFELRKGTNSVRSDNLPASMDAQSITVSVNDLTILSV